MTEAAINAFVQVTDTTLCEFADLKESDVEGLMKGYRKETPTPPRISIKVEVNIKSLRLWAERMKNRNQPVVHFTADDLTIYKDYRQTQSAKNQEGNSLKL